MKPTQISINNFKTDFQVILIVSLASKKFHNRFIAMFVEKRLALNVKLMNTTKIITKNFTIQPGKF